MFSPALNPDSKLSWDGPLLVVDDFLLNIDDFREELMAHGGFATHQKNQSVVDVGPTHDWRQILSSESFPAEFNARVAHLQGAETPVQAYGTNRFYSDMKLESRKQRSSNYPHTDHVVGRGPLPIVFNLWLHDGGGGTGFYTYDDHYSSSAMSPELRYFAENHNPPDHSAQNGVSIFNNYFRGNEEWKLWKVAAMKKNRAFVYCGDLWHRVLVPDGEFVYPHSRFSFVSFSTSTPERFIRDSGSQEYLRAR